MNENPSELHDIAVVGAGPAGLTAALALAECGLQTLCVGPRFTPNNAKPDTRTIALMGGSIELLKTLGVWNTCANHSEALRTIQMIDATGNSLTAPTVEFHARELGLAAFGYNVPVTILIAALQERLDASDNAEHVETRAVQSIDFADDRATLNLSEGTSICASLVAGADGRNSIVRRSAGIETITWEHDQKAIACNFAHTKPHNNISTEFHRKPGPFTLVPLPGNNCGLVWVEKSERVAEIMTYDDGTFIAAMQDILRGHLGNIVEVGPRAAFPLSVQTAKSFGEGRAVLIGEAAHTFPPIGAQGLNLSFRDAAMFVECATAAKKAASENWASEAVTAYDKARRLDVWTRTAAVDLLNRSLMTDFLPFQAARSFGLQAMRLFAPLRRFTMRRGLEPISERPKLMRPGATPADLCV